MWPWVRNDFYIHVRGPKQSQTASATFRINNKMIHKMEKIKMIIKLPTPQFRLTQKQHRREIISDKGS